MAFTDDEIIAYNLLFIAGWSALTVFIMKLTGRSHEYSARVVSLIHALLSTFMCLYALYFYYPHSDFCARAKKWELIAISNTFGYFFMDAIGMLFSGFDVVFMLHHVISLAGFIIPLMSRTNAYEVVVVILLLEFSNPPMHLHWLLVEHQSKANREPSAFHVFVRRSFYVCFFIGRFIFGPWSLYEVSTRSCTYWFHAFVGLCFQVVSCHFFVDLMMKVRRREAWR